MKGSKARNFKVLIVSLVILLWSVIPVLAQNSPVAHIDLPLVPASVKPGSSAFTLTVNGSGFVSGSTVYWDGSARATTFVSGMQLTALINAGDVAAASTASVMVVNPAPGGGCSNVAFLQITNPVSTISLSGVASSTGDSPVAVAAANFNGDSFMDLAIANESDNTVSILLGNGNGTFQPQVTYPTGAGPLGVAVGDFNHDGFLDLAVVNSGENKYGQLVNTVSILLGNGDGTFQPQVDYSTGQLPVSVAVGDFNGDGNLDLAVVAQYDNAVSILLGNGDGTFQPEIEYGVSGQPMDVVVSDFNHDGSLDLGVANYTAHTVSILLGNGDGTFQPASDYNATQNPSSLVAADFNGDGIPDLAVADFGSSAVSILLGNGDGTFQNQVRYATGVYPESVTTGDFNGDGILDLALATDNGLGSVSILLGNGSGTFQSAVNFPAGLLPVGIAAADFSGDGSLDIAAADANNNTASILLGSTLVYAPTSLSFGNLNLGVSSSPQSVTLANLGANAVSISNIVTSAPFAQTNTCGASLAAGSNCSVSVTFTPSAAGTANGTLTITDNATGSPQTVALSGSGTGATASFNPSSLNFGNQAVNTSSTGQTVTMTNTGNATLNIGSITTTGSFQVSGSSCASTLAVSASCNITVIFDPTQSGPLSGSVNVSDNGYASPQTVTLTGTGVQGNFTFNPSSLTFAVQLLNTTSAGQTVTLTNAGTAPVTISSVITPASFPQTNTCGTSVAAGASCTMTVTFHPTNIGSLGGTINIYDNAPNSPQQISVSGTGTQVSLNPTSLNFGSINLGITSSAMVVTLTNLGSNALTITSSQLGGTNPSDFAEINNCGSSVAAGASCSYDITFTPGGMGGRNATLSINDSGGASPQVIGLAGTGTSQVSGPEGSFSPTGLNFGNQNYNVKSAVSKVTLTNTGSAALAITSISTTGNFADTTTCPSSLAAGANCTISVTFTPKSVGAQSGTVSVLDNAPDSPETVPLTGTGVGALAAVSPGSLSFGVQVIGTSSPSQPVTLTNTGNAALSITSITPPASFTETNNCGSSLAAAASCTINVSLEPAKTGTLSGNLTIKDNAAGSASQSVALSGTGTAMSITPSSLTFGTQNLGTTSAPQVVSVTNKSTSAVTVNSVSFTGTNSTDFAQTNTCGKSLAADATCDITVTFTPGGTGSRSASLSLNDTGGASPQTVPVSGTGNPTGSGPQITFNPTSLNFGDQNYNTISKGQNITVYSTGSSTLNISSVTASGNFQVVTNGCPASMAPGTSCTVNLTFTPESVGAIGGSLNVADNATGSPQAVPLSGTGEGSVPVVSTTSLTFAAQVVNTSSASQPVTLSNQGNISLTVNSISVPSGYSQTNNCGSSVAAGASCTINVTFTPTKSGTVSGTMTISDTGAGNTSQKISLSGTGTYAKFSPTSLNFGTVGVGASSTPQNVILTNTNTVSSMTISSVTMTGNDPSDFSQTNNCGKSLAAGASCTITVTFTPQATGSRTASLSVADSGGGGSQTVALSGTGD
jgi:FG-GAP-like repeat/Abnormal spindle-like microcephaly-assoc'd, ASPM-SPD-2-Hydin/Protein of unknown function (DUF1573)